MIDNYRLDILNFLFFSLILMIFSTLQSSPFFQSLSLNSPPQIWIIFTAYCAVYKHPALAVFITYLSSFFYSSLTSESFGKLLCFHSIIFLLYFSLRNLNLKDKKIFFISCLSICLLLPFMDWMLSNFIAVQTPYTSSTFRWMASAFFTVLTFFIIIPLLSKIDFWTERLKIPPEKRF